MFYRLPGTSSMDFDFQGMHLVRAYSMSQSVRLHITLSRLVTPELGWPDGLAVLDRLSDRLTPLADGASRRYEGPLHQEVSRLVAGQP
jgi:hypothetical protein